MPRARRPSTKRSPPKKQSDDMFRMLLCAHLLQQGGSRGCPVPGKVVPAPSADLTVVSINLSSVNNNRFEYVRDLGDAELNAGFDALSRAFGAMDGSALVGSQYTPAMFSRLMVHFGFAGSFGNLYDEYKRMTVRDFLASRKIEKTRAVSLIDREEAFSGRPSIFGRMTDFTLSPDRFVDRWNRFMKNRTVAPIPSPRYDGDLERHGVNYRGEDTVPYQIILLAIYDLLAYLRFQRAIAETGVDIRALVRKLDKSTACKDAVLLELVAYRAKQLAPAVVCIQEASTTFLDKLRRKLGREFKVFASPASKPDTTQQVGMVVSAALNPVVDRRIDTMAESDNRTMFIAIELNGQKLIVGSHHSKSDKGWPTAKFNKAASAARSFDYDGTIMGMDSNAVWESGTKATRQEVDEFVADMGGETTEAVNTTNRIRSNFGIQASKNGEKDQNPKDLVAWVGNDIRLESFYVDSSGSTASLDDWRMLTTPIPSAAFPTDHAMVAARFGVDEIEVDYDDDDDDIF